MTEPVPPAEGLVRREINGVEYWYNEATRKVHSPVSVGRKIVHAFEREAAKVVAAVEGPAAPPVPPPAAPVVEPAPAPVAPPPMPPPAKPAAA